MQEIIEKWKLNKGLLASKINMPLGTFCNKLNPKHTAYFKDKEIIRLKMVLKEICGDIEEIADIDFNNVLGSIIGLKNTAVNIDKYILDCCCGSRMFWFNKSNPDVLFADIRELDTDLCDGRKLEVKPDIIADFRKMPFADSTFKMVVFDPPHLHKLGKTSWMAQKYGVLLPSWEHDIKEGFSEAMRVLQPYGTLIFKWNEIQITTSKILQVIGVEPLFGHPSGKHGRTKWMAFMKGVSI